LDEYQTLGVDGVPVIDLPSTSGGVGPRPKRREKSFQPFLSSCPSQGDPRGSSHRGGKPLKRDTGKAAYSKICFPTLVIIHKASEAHCKPEKGVTEKKMQEKVELIKDII